MPHSFDTADPLDPALVHQRARQLLDDERQRDAIEIIDAALRGVAGTSPTDAYRLLMIKGEAHRQLGAFDAAIHALEQALLLDPEDEKALFQLAFIAGLAGWPEQTRGYQEHLYAVQARRLPERLRDGLDMIWDRIDAVDVAPAALTWAWELADQSAWPYTEWERRARWGRQARLLVSEWWAAAPERTDQLDALLGEIELGALHRSMLDERPWVLVSGHVGPSSAILPSLFRSNQPFETFGALNRARLATSTIGASLSPIASLRPLVTKLRQGVRIGLLADEPQAVESAQFAFLGRTVELPTFVPRLIQACNATSWWVCPLWQDGRVVLELVRLPDPDEGEPRDTWMARWFDAYLACLGHVMRGAPENLGLFAGIWGNVNPDVLRERQRRKAARPRPAVHRARGLPPADA
jgi:hypothetical protein